MSRRRDNRTEAEILAGYQRKWDYAANVEAQEERWMQERWGEGWRERFQAHPNFASWLESERREFRDNRNRWLRQHRRRRR